MTVHLVNRASLDADLDSSPTSIAGARRVPLGARSSRGVEHVVETVIEERAIRTVFQPVVHLASGSLAGFEALTRGPAGTALESPLALLDAARLAGRLGELDWLCRTQAMQTAADAGLPGSLSWLVNVEPAGLAMQCPAHLQPTLARARAELRVILEVVERDLQGNVLELINACDQARRDSWGVALDDVGAEEASLALLPFLSPDVVKLDMSLVEGLPNAEAAAVTAAVRAYAERSGAVILAEGIENEEQERLAKVFGAAYGQGYYYGRPGPLPASVAVPSHPIPLRQHLPPLDGRTPFDIVAETLQPHREARQHLEHISAHLEAEAGQGSRTSVLLAGFQDEVFFTPAKQERYRALSADNALTIVLAQGLPVRDEPTYHVGPLPHGSRLREEWVVIVLNIHYAAAFVARDCGDTGPDAERRFDFIFTHHRPTVINAARSFIQDLAVTPALLPAASTEPATLDSDPALLVADLSDRPVPPAADRFGAVQPGFDDSGNAASRTGSPSAASSVVAPGRRAANGFRATSEVVLNYLKTTMPMGMWAITRVENDRQTCLYADVNDYGISPGTSTPWQDTYCVHMVAGTAPAIAADTVSIPAYASLPINRTVQIGAYAGAPITEPDGSLFGVICGIDRAARDELDNFGPTLQLLSELLTIALANDRALADAQHAARAALTSATTDSLTGVHNRRGWDDKVGELDRSFANYADPTIVVVIDLDNLKGINDGPGGHRAGDQLLRTATDVMSRYIRGHDFLARIGGDEFGIILTRCPVSLASAIIERLNRALERAAIPASIGWAPLRSGASVHHAIDIADQAMFHAKGEKTCVETQAS